MRPSSCTGQVLGHTTAPGPLVTGPTAAALSRALLNVSMPLLGRDRACMAWASRLSFTLSSALRQYGCKDKIVLALRTNGWEGWEQRYPNAPGADPTRLLGYVPRWQDCRRGFHAPTR